MTTPTGTRKEFRRQNIQCHSLDVDGALAMAAQPIVNMAAPVAKTGAVTLTGAEVAGGWVAGTPGAAANYTLPTAALFETAMLATQPSLQVGDTGEFVLMNHSLVAAAHITIVAGTGWTLSGNMVVQANEGTSTREHAAIFRWRRTAANAYTLYRIT